MSVEKKKDGKYGFYLKDKDKGRGWPERDSNEEPQLGVHTTAGASFECIIVASYILLQDIMVAV